MQKQTFYQYLKFILFALLFTVISLSLACLQFCNDSDLSTKNSMQTSGKLKDITVIIDAGHGGIDSGAVGKSGVFEKELNLAISKELGLFLSITDIEYVLTRTDDRMLYREGQEHRRKYYDLTNRIEIADKQLNPLFVSIHQNNFPTEKYNGLQVYYSPNNIESGEFARIVQDKTRAYLQPDNSRRAKESGKNIYLLKTIKCPAVIVECGFLSNSEEEKMLCDAEYQRKLSFIIFSSIMDYISNQNTV